MVSMLTSSKKNRQNLPTKAHLCWHDSRLYLSTTLYGKRHSTIPYQTIPYHGCATVDATNHIIPYHTIPYPGATRWLHHHVVISGPPFNF